MLLHAQKTLENYSVFVGCSFTYGIGFELLDKEPGLWVNLLHSDVKQLKSTNLINSGVGGASNERIFYKAVSDIIYYCPKYMFVQWTNDPRYNITLGVETYKASRYFSMGSKLQDMNLHSVKYTESYLDNIRNKFLSLHHPHGGIVKIIEYTSTLINLAKKFNTQIFFINGLCPWDNEYFTKLKNVLPNSYTDYTKEILDSDTRDDEEIIILYDKIHNEYKQAGTIQQTHWLNLYWSFMKNMIDKNSDNIHPGLQSNLLYYNFIKTLLLEKIN